MTHQSLLMEKQLVLRALAAGKAPEAQHEQLFVGRSAELAMFERDLDVIEGGGASLRIMVGDPGSGKTMLQHALGRRARQRRFVTMNADLSPDRLFHGNGGEGRALLEEAVMRMRTLGADEATGLGSVVGRFTNDCGEEAANASRHTRDLIRERLHPLHTQPGGADFARVIEAYAVAPDFSPRAESARRWLCGGYTTISEARDALGISSIVKDQDFWSMIKLCARFTQIADRPGLVLFIDEARVLCDLSNSHARALNLELLLSMLNDVFQDRAHGIGLYISVTPPFVTQWNGLAKHDGLKSCFGQKPASSADSLIDAVLIQIADLDDAELIELLTKVNTFISECHPDARSLPTEAFEPFLESCRQRIGEHGRQLPRNVVQGFIQFQNRLASNPTVAWNELLPRQSTSLESPPMNLDGYAHRQM